MSAFSVTTVWPVRANGSGWLTDGVVLIVTDRLPCATAQAASVTAWFITIEPVRALITTLAAGVGGLTSRFSMSAMKRDARVRRRRHAHADRAAVDRVGGAAAHPGVDRPHHFARGRVVAAVEVELDRVALASGVGDGALDGRAVGNAAGAQVVDLHLRAAGRGAGAADDQVALRHRVDLAVGALQRRRDQRAAAQALGVGERRDVDVDRLARAARRPAAAPSPSPWRRSSAACSCPAAPSRPSAAASRAGSGW